MSKFANILTAAAVSFGVATVAAPAAKTPQPLHKVGTAVINVNGKSRVVGSPSLADLVKAQGRRIDALQVKLADTRSIALEADSAAAEAESVTGCLTTATGLIQRADDTIVSNDADALPDDIESFIVPMLDADCVAS